MKTILPLLVATFAIGCTVSSTNSSADGGSPAPVGTSDGGASTSDSGSATVNGGCDFAEPNNSRETAKPIALDTAYTGLCAGGGAAGAEDVDFFEITAPNDAAGGYVRVEMTNVSANGLAEFNVFAVADNGQFVGVYTTNPGESIYGWFTVSPGAKYRIETKRFAGGEQFHYDLALKYTKIDDAFEPNDKREDAKPITVGTPIKASAAAHSPNGADLPAGADDDWYKVTLAAGTATVKVTTVPVDHMCDVTVFDSGNQSVGENYQTTPGADCTLNLTNLAGGEYRVVHHRFAGRPDHGAAGQNVPEFVTKQYTLTVTQ